MAQTTGAERGLTRFEGFTDAVFAIALTLLIVEIRPPGSPDGPEAGASLLHAMMRQWREHLALVISFLSIGAYWINHHYTGRIYIKSDYAFSLINLGFVFAIMVLPYPVRIWCFHVGTEHEHTAAITLAIGLFAPALFWIWKWTYAIRGQRLIDTRLAPDYISQMTRRYYAATALHLVALLLVIWMARPALMLAFGVVAYFLVPQPVPRYIPGREPSEEEIIEE
jgi:uncharacterized membrane protein